MSQLLFPDNTVLINFAILKRIDLLDHLLHNQGAWCASVSAECARSAKEPGLEALRDVPDVLGVPLIPQNRLEHLDTRTFRDGLARPGDGPLQHLGEAETLAIITRRGLDGVFVTDDREAARLAGTHHVPVANTWHLLGAAGRVGLVDADTLWGYVQTLRSARRGRPPEVTDRPSLDKWLGLTPI